MREIGLVRVKASQSSVQTEWKKLRCWGDVWCLRKHRRERVIGAQWRQAFYSRPDHGKILAHGDILGFQPHSSKSSSSIRISVAGLVIVVAKPARKHATASNGC